MTDLLSRRSVIVAAAALALLPGLPGRAWADPAAQAFLEKIFAAYKGKNSKGVPLDTDAMVRAYFEPGLAAMLIKDSVNAASDAMGFTEALRHAFHIHELGHAHWAAHNENRYPVGLPPDVEDWRNAKPTKLARRDTP